MMQLSIPSREQVDEGANVNSDTVPSHPKPVVSIRTIESLGFQQVMVKPGSPWPSEMA